MTNTTSPPPAKPLLEADSISRQFQQAYAVRAVSMKLYAGEVTGFLGLNGAGKTTTLRMLCGTLAPDSGTVTINGVDLRDDPQNGRARLGFLPDEPPLYPELTVDEFLAYCAQLRNLQRPEIADACARVKTQTGLDDWGHRRIGALSRGYRQRLGIAQAIIHRPSVIVLDEPTSGLDPRQIEGIRGLLRKLSENAAVLLSTHQLADVLSVCDRAIIIHHGSIVGDTPVRDTLAQTFFDLTGASAA